MSKIGRKSITIPKGVTLEISGPKQNFWQIFAKGPRGELQFLLPESFLIEKTDQTVKIWPKRVESKQTRALWGTFRANLLNIIEGVLKGFEKKLEIEGIGYRAAIQGKKLVLQVGFVNPVEVEPPAGIEFKVDKNVITVSGLDKALVSQVAAKIRAVKPPEPYKGKGIRYLGEVVRRKAGKKAVAAGGP